MPQSPRLSRDDDSLNAATVKINDAQTRIAEIENKLSNPDQLSRILAPAYENSSLLRNELAKIMLGIMDDYDTRKEIEKILLKIDRDVFLRFIKFVFSVLVGIAAICGSIFAYMAVK